MKGNVYRLQEGIPLALVLGICQFGVLIQWLDIHDHGNNDESFIFLEGDKAFYQVNPHALQFAEPNAFAGLEIVDKITPEVFKAWMCDQTLQQAAQLKISEVAQR